MKMSVKSKSRKPKSKVSIRNMFRINTGKKVLLGVLVCAVVFGVYAGLHRYNSKAGDDTATGPKITRDGTKRGCLNSISDIKGKDTSKTLGSPENPFVILEIVPWTGRSMIGYQIKGCEPFDFEKYTVDMKKKGQDCYGFFNSYADVRTCDYSFEDEECPESWRTDDPGKDGKWKKIDSETTLWGYYEKLDPNDAALTDDKYLKEHNNGELTRFEITKYEKVAGTNNYEPVFEKKSKIPKDKQTGEDFIWVTYGGYNGVISDYVKENKYADTEDGKVRYFNRSTKKYEEKETYILGDRFYTSRTDKGYYQNGSNFREKKWVYRNNFLRESLGVKSRKDVENYCVFVKTIEPKELNANPEWIDYANLMYMHIDENMTDARRMWKENPDYRLAKQPADALKTDEYILFGRKPGDDYWQDKQNDITWEVALKIFKKINGIGEYEGEYENKDGGNLYAPLIMDPLLFRNREQYNYTLKNDICTKKINYSTMKCEGDKAHDTGYKNNVYKLMLMNLYMNPSNFYTLFCTDNENNENKPVIQTKHYSDTNTDEGICSIQDSDDAKLYWNFFTFAPYDLEIEEKFDDNIKNGSDSKLSEGLFDGTYIFNSNNQMNAQIRYKMSGLDEVLGWFNNLDNIESGLTTPKDGVSSLDVIYYLLHNHKGGSSRDNVRRENKFTVLDIEPCNDYSTLTKTKLRTLFPPSKYKSKIKVDRMTTAEFNSSKKDIISNYDVVYLGIDTGKMNSDKGTIKYNDPDLDGDIYTHVGDLFKGDIVYRTSGNDLTSLSMKKLKAYAKSGNIVLLPDELYAKSSKYSEDTYKKILDVADKTDGCNLNVYKFLKMINEDMKDAKNVTCLSEQSKKNAALGTFVADANVDIVDKSDGSHETGVTYKGSDNKYYMDFSFIIGECGNNKYKVKLLIDQNGDGTFTDDSKGSEVVKIWDDEYGKSEKKDGKYVPHKVTYNLGKYSKSTVSWKFVVYNKDKEEAYIEETGVSKFDTKTESDSHEINALQIVADNKVNDSKVNIQKQLKEGTSKLAKDIKGVKGYTINIETKSVSEYRDMFKDKDQKFVVDGEAHYYSDKLDDYNLFIVSCGNALTDDILKSDRNSVGNIKYSAVSYLAYLDTVGVGVIYTQGTVNGSNLASEKVIKDAFNLSRFTSAGVNNSMYTDTTAYYKKSTGDYKTLNGNAAKGRNELEYTYYAVMKNYRNDGDQYIYNDDTYYAAKENNKNNGGHHYVYNDDIWGKIQSSGKELGIQKAESIDRNNKGAVTTYPYEIKDDSIKIKGTEAQNYQFNLNNPNATVWYSLGGADDTAYGISPKDGSNNYYLCNAGNVFYSGISLENTDCDDEIKLFVNTMIAACGSTSNYPSVTVDDVTDDETGSDKCAVNLKKAGEELASGGRLKNSKTKKEYMFDANLGSAKSLDIYKEYRKDASGATPKPEETPKPDATAKPMPTEKPAVDPSSPEDDIAADKKVAVLFNNKFASSGEYYRCENADWMKGLDDNAVIQIQYTSGDSVYSDEEIVKVEVNGKSFVKKLKACSDETQEGAESDNIQQVNLTLGEMRGHVEGKKDKTTGAITGDITSIIIRPNEVKEGTDIWKENAIILSVRLITENGYIGNYAPDNSTNTTTPSWNVKSVNWKEDPFKTDKEKHTHKIYFTPKDGNFEDAFINKLTVAYTDGMYGNETTVLPIQNIYTGSNDNTQAVQSSNGKYLKSDGNCLVDGVGYYILYNKSFAKDGYNYIRFTIENDKHKSTTYIQVNDLAKPENKDVYMFDLD